MKLSSTPETTKPAGQPTGKPSEVEELREQIRMMKAQVEALQRRANEQDEREKEEAEEKMERAIFEENYKVKGIDPTSQRYIDARRQQHRNNFRDNNFPRTTTYYTAWELGQMRHRS